jgi:phosphocarrier protein|tara:strand:+ start:5820 stop:6089 length:270 start_codon:yes stop_codon:yes gene_type:complete
MIKRKIKIINELGLHARAASRLVQTAQQFSSQIQLSKGAVDANGKNIMSVLLLAAARDSIIDLQIDGDDETDALEALTMLINDRFGEER